MSLYSMFALALAMSADAFSFSLGLGMTGASRRQTIFLTVTVLLFHIGMPLTGYYAGEFLGAFLGRWAGTLGALILILLGFRMIWGGLVNKPQSHSSVNVLSSFNGIMVLGTTVSMDALSVGFTLGVEKAPIGLASLIIGLVAGTATFIGLGVGRQVGEWVGHRAVLLGGVVLVFLGIDMLM